MKRFLYFFLFLLAINTIAWLFEPPRPTIEHPIPQPVRVERCLPYSAETIEI